MKIALIVGGVAVVVIGGLIYTGIANSIINWAYTVF